MASLPPINDQSSAATIRSESPVIPPDSWRAFMQPLVCASSRFCNHECEGRVRGKVTTVLLAKPDLAHQLGVTRVGAQGIEREVCPDAIQQVAVFLVCGGKPPEGMVLVPQIGI